MSKIQKPTETEKYKDVKSVGGGSSYGELYMNFLRYKIMKEVLKDAGDTKVQSKTKVN